MAEVSFGRVARVLEGSAYVAVGFGVLGFQKAQVARRDLQRRLSRVSPPGAGTAQPAPAPAPRLAPGPSPAPADRATQVADKLSEMAEMASMTLAPLVAQAAERASGRLAPLVNDAAERLGERLGEAAQHLPPEAHEFLEAAGELAKDLPAEARELARNLLRAR